MGHRVFVALGIGGMIALAVVTYAASRTQSVGDSFTVRDSLGVRIVESVQAQWEVGAAWQLTPEPLLIIGSEDGPRTQLFDGIIGVGRTESGSVFVADRGSSQLRLFDQAGELVWVVGRRGDGPAEFRSIDRVGLGPGDTAFVFDGGHRRVTLVSPSGQVARSVTLALQETGRLTQVTWLLDGRYLGSLRDLSTVWAVSSVGTLGTTKYVLFDPGGQQSTIVAVGPGSEVQLDPTGREYQTYVVPLYAYREAAVAGRALFHGLSRSREIGVTSYDGRLQAVWRDLTFDATLEPSRVREAALAALARRAPDLDADQMLSSVDVPSGDAIPPYSKMLLDPLDHLWVADFAESDEAPRRWSIFDPLGALLGTLELPDGFSLLWIGESEVLGSHADDLGVETVWSLGLVRHP